ncbi:winged helix-turn-helix domain-containing protein [Desulforegula conservatrix]|uniref:winged helix-turn-helix domain-containing protein n=1 Tax=Desulforegula conservatrix TaxID=153026 RepID=UPI00042848F2|nr:winged helix-turn-helix domain-containing protein [Desulforegula conservatrix]
MYSGDFKNIVFKRVISANFGEVSLDSKMLTVLMEIDGTKDVLTIASNTGLDFSLCAEVLKKLARINLIEPVNSTTDEPKEKSIDETFIKKLLSEFSMAVGPIAEVIYEDEVADMGESIDDFPQKKIVELVNRLAAQIPRDDKRISFKQAMANAIKALKIS